MPPQPPPSSFSLGDRAFAALGAGRPDTATLDLLHRAHLSRHLLLLRELRLSATAVPDWFTRLSTTDPDQARQWIADPMTGLWAAHALRTGAAPDAAPAPRGGHRLTAHHRDLSLRVRVDDSDPLRRSLGLTPAPALTPVQAAHWSACLDEAWRLLVDRHRAAATTVAAVLRVIVPVLPDPVAEGISATSAEAFGAVAMSAPVDGRSLAAGLIHETQHSVLNTVQLLFPLVEPGGEREYSPWREDPRPASGVLHGAYAYLAVTRFWRDEWRAGGSPAGGFEFARWREAVLSAAGDLLDGGRLTPAGERFVTALRAQAAAWRDDPVAPETARLAALANADHRARWRLRNLAVTPGDTGRLADAWRAGQPPPAVTSRLSSAPGRALENSHRLRLAHARVKGDAADRTGDGDAGAGDAACVRGDHGTALRSYGEALVKNRDDDAAWSGLALVAPQRALRARPEVVRAAALALPGADIVTLADWLSG
ncbi:HEXXH motif-containing putative peptide modification protein [Actinoplanes sp. NBRC 101535]|uniref:aKG-HExxH-type peptide beta-hydroxylase n=1 Tax=Actinoplanes sp. NBRC 101535 TaxID=3032196 RepID=UPI0024A5B217|nr:HEXXH motif-containing putative peptide modification protein [Actinoplanes sp. NBRC 101535]GLY01222.1 hypothetical protein Acsp01_16010 [Actinoplanes sp. NBRC 101535]